MQVVRQQVRCEATWTSSHTVGLLIHGRHSMYRGKDCDLNLLLLTVQQSTMAGLRPAGQGRQILTRLIGVVSKNKANCCNMLSSLARVWPGFQGLNDSGLMHPLR